MKKRALSYPYIELFIRLFGNEKGEDNALQNLHEAKELFENNKSLKKVLYSPLITIEEKKGVLNRLFKDKLSPSLLIFLQKIVKQNDEMLLNEVLTECVQKIRKKQGILDVAVTVSEPLTEKDKQNLQDKLSAAFGPIEIQEKVNPKIIGGMTLFFSNNKMLDYSLRAKLDRLQENLREGNEYAT